MMCDPSGGTPTSSSAGPTSVPGVNGAPTSVPPNPIGGPSSVGSGHGPVPSSAPPESAQLGSNSLSNLLNGGADANVDVKQSPNSVPGLVSMNGGGGGGGSQQQQHGGPGSQNNGGPGSAAGLPGGGPGSVHSQSGGAAPNSVNTNINSAAQLQSTTPQSHANQMTPTSGAPADNVLIDFHGQGGAAGADTTLSGDANDEGKAEEILKIKAGLLGDFDKPQSFNFNS